MAAKYIIPYVNLGRTGLLVSRFSLGSGFSFEHQIDVNQAYEVMKRAYELGINLFDNAEMYAEGKSEVIMGEVIERGIKEKVWTRSDLIITTKLFMGTTYVRTTAGPGGLNSIGLSRKHILEGLDASLKRLHLSAVDIVYAHRPDPRVTIEETVRAFNNVIDRGLAYYWGTSEWSARDITEAVEVAERLGLVGPVVEQPQYNVFFRARVEQEYQPLYKKYNLALTIWSPLAYGVLTGKYNQGTAPEGSRFSMPIFDFAKGESLSKDRLDAVEKLKPIAKELGCSLAQLAIAWCLRKDYVTNVILGATKLEQLDENVKSVEFVSKLTPEIEAKIDAIVGVPAPDRIYAQVAGVRRLV